MKKPLISVLMGAYNAQEHIQQAVVSILAQTYQNFELIVVDDGSTDNTLALLHKINDPRLVIIEQKNLGLTKSLNKALAIAKGEYIARQDADDISLQNRFEKQIEAFSKDPQLAMLGSSMYISNPAGVFNEIFHYPTTDEELKMAIFHFNPFIHGAMMVKKSIINEVGGYNEEYRYVQDYELWSRLTLEFKCENLAAPYYARLREADCSENQVDKSGFVESIQSSLESKYPDYKTKLFKTIKSQGIYPIFGWPFRECSELSKTFSGMAKKASELGLENNDYIRKSRAYFPWKRF